MKTGMDWSFVMRFSFWPGIGQEGNRKDCASSHQVDFCDISFQITRKAEGATYIFQHLVHNG